jgi:hypothetical protein
MNTRLFLYSALVLVCLNSGCADKTQKTPATPKTSTNPVTNNPDKIIFKSKLPEPDGDFMREFERIQIMQMGLKVTNLRSNYIGCSEAEPGPWIPITKFKETLKGKLTNYTVDMGHAADHYAGTNEETFIQMEYDWRMIVSPSNTHKELFNDGSVLCEVTPQPNFWDNMWFPIKYSGRPSLLLDYDLCIYGAYVNDPGASGDPDEIHPIEAIWWERKNVTDPEIRVMLVQDAAKGRFREESMYTKKPCDDNYADWKPWVEYPQLEEIKIPFSYDPANKTFTDIRLQVLRALDITTSLKTDWSDNDDGETHQLFLSASDQMNVANDLPVIIRVTEGNDINNKHIAVQFSDLTCDKQGIIRGYVKLLVAVGDSAQRHEGVLVFNLTFREGINQAPPANQN